MTEPARRDGGGDPAASALAFRVVDDATFDAEMARRVRQSLAGDSDAEAALKLGVGVAVVRRACRDGRPSARLLRRICVIYRVDGHWLLSGEGSVTRLGTPIEQLPSGELLETVAQRLAHMIGVLEAARSSRGGDAHPPPGRSTVNGQGQEWL